MIKGKVGVGGMPENPAALARWLLCGPEISCIVDEFE